MLISYWLTPAKILVSEQNSSGFYHGEFRLLSLLENSRDDQYCDKLDKLFFFYVTDADDPILLVYNTAVGSAYIQQGYNRYYGHVIRNRPYWLSAWVVSNIYVDFAVSRDIKLDYHRSVEIFDSNTAAFFLTPAQYTGRGSRIDLALTTRREKFDFKIASQSVLTNVLPGELHYGNKVMKLNGQRAGSKVVVDLRDHCSVVEAIRCLFRQCLGEKL
jgi:hypothetical protein